MKTSLGIWAFGNMATQFNAGGYEPELTGASTAQKMRTAIAEDAWLLASEALLGHQHANSGWGTFDDDNMVGATAFMETIELAVELRRAGYGDNGERLGFDLLNDQSKQTVTVWLSYFLGSSRHTDWGALMAGSTLTAIPVVVFFLLVQRKIAFGLTAGAVRG